MEKKSRKMPQKSKNDLEIELNLDLTQIEEQKNNEEQSLLDKMKPIYKFASSDIECKICNVFCTGPKVYKQHCESKSHMKKLSKPDISSDSALLPSTSKNGDSDFYCDVCNKEISGVLQYKQHIEGKAHFKQLKYIRDLEKFKDLIILSEENSEIQCSECGKKFTGTVPFKEHLNTSAHSKLKKKKVVENFVRQYQEDMIALASLCDDESDSDDDESDSEDSEEESEYYKCKLCDVNFSGPESARDHFTSEKHQKVEKKALEYLSKQKIIDET